MSIGCDGEQRANVERVPTPERHRRVKSPALLPCLLCDSREQLPIHRHLSPAVTYELGVTLQTGDYSLRGYTELCAWERKSLPDLIGSLTQGRERFSDCIRRLAKYQYKALLIEATREEVFAHAYRSLATPQSIIGSTRSFLTDWGIATVWCGDAKGVAAELEWMALRITKLEQRREELKMKEAT